MNLSAEQLQANWEEFLGYIDRYISSPRKESLRSFYEDRVDRFIIMPASHTTKYHNCFPGGGTITFVTAVPVTSTQLRIKGTS